MINRKTIAAGALAALTAGGAILATTESADAQWRRGGRGAAVAAGVVGGLALGAIAASAAQPRYYDPGYGYYEPAYGPSYGYGGGYYAEPVYAQPRYGYYEAAPVYEPYAYQQRRPTRRARSVDYGAYGPTTYSQTDSSR